MRGARGSFKEPVTKKTSGVGVLMSALHQSASSLVTTRAEHNGPNQVLSGTEYLTSRRNLAVKLRKEESGLGAEEPVSVPHLLQETAETYPEVLVFKIKDKSTGEWDTWNYLKLSDEVQTVAKAFIELGLHRHHSVAILAENSPQWIVANLAAISAGGISVGVQPTMSPEDLAKVALDSKADVFIVEHELQLKKVLLIQHKLPELKAIIQILGDPSISDKRRLHKSHKKHILSWQGLREIGKSTQETRLDDRLRRVAINQCCTIAYSNGRNSPPKGVMYSHDNLTWTGKSALGFIRAPGFNKNPLPGEEVLLSYLPLSHISTQIIDLYYLMTVAGTLVFPSTNVFNEVDSFFAALKEVQPTILYGPPVIFERIYHRLLQIRRSVSGVERFFLDWTSQSVSQKLGQHGSATSRSNKIGHFQHKIVKNTVCKKYKESLGLGPHMVYICRGGSLQDRLLRFLAGFDVVVHSAYGQSETTGFLTSNIPKRFCKFTTVGKPIPGVKLKIEKNEGSRQGEDTGEVLGFGRNIFMGYLNKENENQSVLAEGWLRLGDQATQDSEGFLLVHGQKEDELLMLNGVVDPSHIEGNLRLELPCISSCIVIAHGTDRLGVLLSLDTQLDENGFATNILTQQTVNWFRATRFEVQTITDVIEYLESGLKHVVQAGIDRANQVVQSSCHMIVEWRVLPNSFSVSTGELGPTLQIRRGIILQKYAEHINQMLTYEGRKHSFTESLGGESYNGPGEYERFTRELHQIIEEEERSNRNSVDKEVVPNDTNNNKERELQIFAYHEPAEVERIKPLDNQQEAQEGGQEAQEGGQEHKETAEGVIEKEVEKEQEAQEGEKDREDDEMDKSKGETDSDKSSLSSKSTDSIKGKLETNLETLDKPANKTKLSRQ